MQALGLAHTKPRASQLMFVWPVMRALDLHYDRISHYKVSRATKLDEQSQSGRSNVQTYDVIRILHSDWCVKILAHRSKTVQAVLQSLCVIILKEPNTAEGP